jgi:hypothetical protein
MTRIALFGLLMVAVLWWLSLAAETQAGAQVSPLPTPTLELTPPFRPTPTGWPGAPFPTVTPPHPGPLPTASRPAPMGTREGGSGANRLYLPIMMKGEAWPH